MPNNKDQVHQEEVLETILKNVGTKKEDSIKILQEMQKIFGHIPIESLKYISQKSNEISASELYSVATFYNQFRLKPLGKNLIKICHGTACHVRGAANISKTVEEILGLVSSDTNSNKSEQSDTTKDQLFTLTSVACIGCCSIAPAAMVNEKIYGKLTSKDAIKILEDIKMNRNYNIE